MITAKELSQIMGVGRDKAYHIMKSGVFPTINVGRMLIAHREKVDEWLKNGFIKKKK